MLWWGFITSECLFFGSLITTYLVYKGQSLTGPYPHDVLNIPVTSVSTFVLLTSSLAMVLALAGIQAGNLGRFRLWMFATVLLGLTFLGFQAYEFTTFVHEGLTLQRNLFGATFFILTGFHGTHVAVGVLWLLSLFLWSFSGGLTAENAINVEVAGLYWHFVDVVWIAIFTLVYLIP